MDGVLGGAELEEAARIEDFSTRSLLLSLKHSTRAKIQRGGGQTGDWNHLRTSGTDFCASSKRDARWRAHLGRERS